MSFAEHTSAPWDASSRSNQYPKHYLGPVYIGVRDGGQGGQLPPPQKITKSESRANVQHKSGEEWEIKKPKSPQFVGQTKAVGQ
jgi:hypothetical protein